jgi:large subunit ribosomal protein L25
MLFRNRKLTIKALPANLPDFFNVNISKLRIGEHISVEALKSDAFTILHPDNTVIVQVKTSRTAVQGNDDEAEEGEEEGSEAAE